jgi:hypothetical protein
VALLIHRSFNVAFDALSPPERDMLRARFCEPIMHKFIDAMVNAAKEQMEQLDPSAFEDNEAQKFLYAAKETRSIWQFWSEFASFVNDWAKEPTGRAHSGDF